jgi:ABC-type nitrate/sulfonate/bicarbonate transport system ATPase subunit
MNEAVRVAALTLEGVERRYGRGDTTVEVLTGASLELSPGQSVALIAPSGAGKSTLLHLAGLLERPNAGEVRIGGAATSTMSDDKRTALRRTEIGFVYQFHHLLPEFSALENLVLPQMIAGLSRVQAAARARELLAYLGLAERESHRPAELSGGEQQRVAIARAVAYEPHVLLMDEPFAAVDAQTRADLEDLIRVLWHKLRVTVLFVTHDIDESVYLGQRVLVMSHAPTVIMEDVAIDLPGDRTQLETRSMARFGELRKHIYSQIQLAKQGWRPPGG